MPFWSSKKSSADKDNDKDKEKLKKMNTHSNTDINILLFGETGVGKSTFINAFVNYLKNASLSEAMKHDFMALIPTKFTVLDENYKERVIEVGSDDNESTEVGASATQKCRAHTFIDENHNLKIRLIDTPGIADTRGIQKDKINFENILTFISELKHLNAICILLKPNVSKLTVQFEYCIHQLLCRLDISASNNLVFVFTNTRSTFYRPGETYPSLRSLLGKIRSVQIPLDKKNTFCMDNESLRFLAAYKSGVKFNQKDIDDFSQSWKNSSEELWRMIRYISGWRSDENPLNPHKVQDIISINEARRLIIQLSKPLSEIVQLNQENISLLQKQTRTLISNTDNIKKLKESLYSSINDLEVIKLPKPVTVCTFLDCSIMYQVNNIKKWHYKQRCHDPCTLDQTPPEIIGSPELVGCAAMNSSGNCTECGCSYKLHMHIYYETRTTQRKLINTNVQDQIKTVEDANRVVNNHINILQSRVEEYEKEQSTILKTTAKFAHFLNSNAIAPCNDSYQGYLKMLINCEEKKVDADFEILSEYKQLLKQYEEEKKILEQALKNSATGKCTITARDIMKSVKVLYSLKNYGKKILEMIEAQESTRQNEYIEQNMEYIYHINFDSDMAAAIPENAIGQQLQQGNLNFIRVNNDQAIRSSSLQSRSFINSPTQSNFVDANDPQAISQQSISFINPPTQSNFDLGNDLQATSQQSRGFYNPPTQSNFGYSDDLHATSQQTRGFNNPPTQSNFVDGNDPQATSQQSRSFINPPTQSNFDLGNDLQATSQQSRGFHNPPTQSNFGYSGDLHATSQQTRGFNNPPTQSNFVHGNELQATSQQSRIFNNPHNQSNFEYGNDLPATSQQTKSFHNPLTQSNLGYGTAPQATNFNDSQALNNLNNPTVRQATKFKDTNALNNLGHSNATSNPVFQNVDHRLSNISLVQNLHGNQSEPSLGGLPSNSKIGGENQLSDASKISNESVNWNKEIPGENFDESDDEPLDLR